MSSFRKEISESQDAHEEIISNYMTESERFSTEAILVTMYNEQSEHLYYKFSDAYIKYRQVVAEWMVDVAEYFNLHPTTTHAAVAYLDRLQPNEKFTRHEWQMLAICCLLISSKFNECEEHVPSLRKLEEITQQAISNSTILNYELWALKRMGWKLNARVPASFLATYLTLGVTFDDDEVSPLLLENMEEESLQEHVENQVTALATACVLDISYKHFQASVIACAILYFVRLECGISPAWRCELTTLTFHDATTNKYVNRVLHMLRAAREQETVPESSDSDSSLNEDMFACAISPASPQPTRSPVEASKVMCTPEQNKENSKTEKESPVSIASLALA